MLAMQVDAQPVDRPEVRSAAYTNYSDKLDKVLTNWEVKNAQKKVSQSNENSDNDIWEISRPAMVARFNAIQTQFSTRFHPDVEHYVRLLTEDKRKSTEAMLGMTPDFFKFVEPELKKRNMPPELKYLPMVLSGMNWRCTGSYSRGGLWMLHYHTALKYGVTINSRTDERRLTEPSTIAALNYLKDLHQQFGDWNLAIAAYSIGPAEIRKAIRRNSGKQGFWSLYANLNDMEREIIPALYAAIYVGKYYNDHKLNPLNIKRPVFLADVVFKKEATLETLAEKIRLDVKEIHYLNPALKGDKFGPETSIKIPSPKLSLFKLKEEEIYAASAEPVLQPAVDSTVAVTAPIVKADTAEVEIVEALEPTPEPEPVIKHAKTNSPKIEYTIRTGDVLGKIAERFDVSVEKIQMWNRISGTSIRAGEVLKIFITKEKKAEYEASLKTADTRHAKPRNPGGPATKFTKYIVKSGDSLWLIAQKYEGVTAEDIMKHNKITEDLKPGQELSIPQAR